MSKRGPHPMYAHIGARIRARRKSQSMSQPELGRRIGVTFQQIGHYETGRHAIYLHRLIAIADALGVTLEYFLHDLPRTIPFAAMAKINAADFENCGNVYGEQQ